MRSRSHSPGKIVEGEILLRRKDGSKVDLAKIDATGPQMRSIRR
ncbi:MAG: hypothetical protein R2856_09810 [Caldilineaceae bacterium]